jgi:hypothetical protein
VEKEAKPLLLKGTSHLEASWEYRISGLPKPVESESVFAYNIQLISVHLRFIETIMEGNVIISTQAMFLWQMAYISTL